MARKAKGTLLKIGDGAGPPEVFTTVAELTSIGLPEFGTGTIDVTNFDSTDEEHVSDGIQAHGEVSIEGNWLPEHATQDDVAGLLSKAIAGEPTNFEVVVNAGAGTKTFAFAAIPRFMPKVGGPKDALKFAGTLKITGGITIT